MVNCAHGFRCPARWAFLVILALVAWVLLTGQGPERADLEAACAHRPLAPEPGEPVTITVTVRNRGEARSVETVLAARVEDEREPRKFAVRALEPGETWSVDLRETFYRPGRHRVEVVADADDAVDEPDERDNRLVHWIEVAVGTPF